MPKPSAHPSNTTAKAKFLAALMLGTTVTKAAKECGINRRTVYDWRDQDAEFAAAWDDAIEESVEDLEAEVRRRALNANDRQSHLLLMFLLKKFKPEYRENHKREVTVKHEKSQEFVFSSEEMDDAIEILTKAKNEHSQKEQNQELLERHHD